MPTSKALDPDSILWISAEEARTLHDEIIKRWGGLEGFPHPGYLDSAVHAPQQQLHYEGGSCDLYDLAAAYLFHIAKAHSFIDGNKRTAYICSIYFLYRNGVHLGLPKHHLALARATERAARGELDKAAIARIIRQMPNADAEKRHPMVVTKEHAAHRPRRQGKRRSKKRYL